MYHPLSLNGYSKIINAVKRQRNLGLLSALQKQGKSRIVNEKTREKCFFQEKVKKYFYFAFSR
jgi:hypothetical protein